MPAADKRKYQPDVLRTHKFRGFVIQEIRNRKNGRVEFKTRFQVNGKRYYLTNNVRADLEEMIDETVYNARRASAALPVEEKTETVSLAELFAKVLPTIEKPHQRKIAERVFANFLRLLPENMAVAELRKNHFQLYIDWRREQTGAQTGQLIKLDTVYKELYAVSNALSKGELYFPALEKWTKPPLPARGEKKRSRSQSRRTRIVSPENELEILLEYLRRQRSGKQTENVEYHRRRLADELEFKLETGLRRKEVARLETKQYKKNESALRNVRRWKTDTTTKFFPLSRRACEIIESRIGDNRKYIFSENGEPSESDYRTLKHACEYLNINYGRYSDDGFVMHDLRHNFASEIIQVADIETARELLGHSNISQTSDYLHTSESRLRGAMDRREKVDIKSILFETFDRIKSGELEREKFVEMIENLLKK